MTLMGRVARKILPCVYSAEKVEDDEVRLADLLEGDEELTSLQHRYYTLERRSIPYRSPALTSHPITVKAKEVADGLNEEYLEVTNLHQEVREKLSDFKKHINQPDYADLLTCLIQLQKSTGRSNPLRIKLDTETESPIKLEGGSAGVHEAVTLFNATLTACHQYLNDMDFHLDRIRERITELRKLAISQHILDICSTFEEHASTNVDIYAMEIRSFLLDAKNSAKQAFKK